MANSFWNFVSQFVPGTLAKAEDVNTNFSGVASGLDSVETEINKAIQVTNAAGTTDIVLNAAARANKLVAFDANGDIAASQILGDWKGNHADAAGTDYQIRDVVKDAAGRIQLGSIYICNTTHTSTGTILTDTANWDLLVDATDLTTLGGFTAAQYLRSDADDTYTGTLTVVGTISGGTMTPTSFTSTGIDDNATVTKLTIGDADLTVTSAHLTLFDGQSYRWGAATTRITGSAATSTMDFYTNNTRALSFSVAQLATFDGDILVDNAAPLIDLTADISNTAQIRLAGNNNTIGASSFDLQQDSVGQAYLWQRNNNSLFLGTNATTAVTIDNTQRVTLASDLTLSDGEVNITQADAAQQGLYVTSNTASRTAALAEIVNDNATGTSASNVALKIQHDPTGNSTKGIELTLPGTGNTAVGLLINHSGTGTGPGVRTTLAGTDFCYEAQSNGAGVGFWASANNTGAKAGRLYSNTASRTVPVAEIINDNATGSGVALSIQQDQGGAAIELVNQGTIKFPATATPSSDANTLDDYQEGEFSVTLSAGTGTITIDTTNDTLSYTKIGRVVYITGRVTVSSTSSPTGNVTILGMPFTSRSGTEESDINTFTCAVSGTTTPNNAIGNMLQGSTSIVLWEGTATGLAGFAADLSGNETIQISGFYFTDL